MSHHSHVMSSGADPEQQLAAMMLVAAREGCAAGNKEDCEWLHSCALAYLALVCPPDVDESDVLMRILEDLPTHDPQHETWRQAAEAFTQAILDAVIEGAEMEHPMHDETPQASDPVGNPMSSQEPCEAPSPCDTAWGRRMNQRPATRPREPTPYQQPAFAGMEAT